PAWRLVGRQRRERHATWSSVSATRRRRSRSSTGSAGRRPGRRGSATPACTPRPRTRSRTMDKPVHMNFDEPPGTHPWDNAPGGKKPHKKKKRDPIPVLPKASKPLTDVDVRRGVSNRARSAANLKVEGYTYQEIADTMELANAAEAKRLVESVLAAIHSDGDLETLRL